MKIGIVTYVKCDNYGAELQAYALQKKLNDMGYDAEVLDLEKQTKNLASLRVIKKSIVNRYHQFGVIKATLEVVRLILDKSVIAISNKMNRTKIEEKHHLFTSFFRKFIRHSPLHYSLSDIYIMDMPYDTYIAGSDQIWNYMQTDYLDVYFLMFANRFHAKKIAYAGSFSVPSIPEDLRETYKKLINNLDYISVRELSAKKIVEDCSGRKATVVLDPTLLLNREEWVKNLDGQGISVKRRYVLIYTLSGSRYIYNLARFVAVRLNCEIINIKSDFVQSRSRDIVTHLYNVDPQGFISLFNNAAYVITDSFHGTAFSINFNKPFTTLLNPSSNMNSRVLSILQLTKLENRLIYDNGSNTLPECLQVDFTEANQIIINWRKKSLDYLTTSLSS